MKNQTFLFFAAVMFLFTVDSCQHHYPVSLVEADSLVYSNPKAALQKLDSLSLCLDTTQKADVMYHANRSNEKSFSVNRFQLIVFL